MAELTVSDLSMAEEIVRDVGEEVLWPATMLLDVSMAEVIYLWEV